MNVKKYSFILLSLPFLLSGCKSFSQTTVSQNDKKMIKGEWVSVEDSGYTLRISTSQIIEYYNNQPIDTFKYELLNHSCDTAYMKPSKEKVLFLKKFQENYDHTVYFSIPLYCFEILGLTKEYLSLQYTVNAKRNLFRRK